MKLLKRTFVLTVGVAILSFVSTDLLRAQDVNASMLLHPSNDSWPGYHGDYSGRRHSHLTQITPQNVGNLGLAWAFQTEQSASIKASPLLIDGILYFTVPDNIWAIDARSGHQIWHYTYPPNKGDHIGQRGVAVYKDWVFFMGPDAHMVSLNAKDGTVRWNVTVADVNKGYWTTMAPLIVGNHVIIGVGGDMDNLPGFLKAIDPETGALQWEWDVTPPAGTPNT
ncbi:MAG: PQQ-binding-like beta-propeller repeat protein, partial [Alloacidobacterium sp.]